MPAFGDLVRHKSVLAAIGIVILILVGSVAYYLIEAKPPALNYVPVAKGAIAEDVVANGTVAPAVNPDLSFTQGGRVTDINVKVGDTVPAGTLLASLDTGVLSANLQVAEANYNQVTAPPRSVDLAGKQTAVAQAETTLANAYQTLIVNLSTTEAGVEDAVNSTNNLFGSLNVVNYPNVNFLTKDSVAAQSAGQERGQLVNAFEAWKREDQGLTASSSPDVLLAAANDALTNMVLVDQFFSDLSAAASVGEPPLASDELAALATARSGAANYHVALTSEIQTIQNDALAVQSAQDALSLIEAGATPEQTAAAEAEVEQAQAALRQDEIIAPFSGTIAAVQVKQDDVVTANQPIVSIVPAGKFEVDVYLSEVDVAKLVAGDAADVTLDAYGPDSIFPATVGTIDTAPTIVNGVPSYKVTLVFTNDDSRISSGMHASATIHAGAKQEALLVPKGAVITEDNQTYVLLLSGKSTMKTPVTVGLVGTSTVEILSGVTEGQQVAAVAGN